jgi:NAD(P)-dependent dehydrogenase (short-subunit alcohol dehydrogenase family)
MSNTTRAIDLRTGSGRMAGKVAVVTGAGSRGDGIGNGRAAALLLAREGAKVIVLDAVRDWADVTARMIADAGGTCRVVTGDVTRPEDCAAATAAATDAWGRLDVLVNNVGVLGPKGTAETVDPEAWDAAMRLNVASMMLMAKFAIPAMRAVGGGAIVNIASFAGLFGGHPNLLYPTSKGAVVNMTRAMAAQHAAERIRVNCVAPGMVYTPMVQEAGMTPEMREARRERSLLKVEGDGWDVGFAVLYLASDEARWVTGVVLPVDAGASAAPATLPVPG